MCWDEGGAVNGAKEGPPPHKPRKSQKTTQSVPLFGDVLERVHAQIQLLEVTQHREIPW